MRRTRHPAFIALVLATGLLGSGSRSALAAAESDIPGVPLPGTVVTGQLGGPIYDVVYRVAVPAASVILASLNGTPGTDFDLYLFASTATTVQNLEGLIGKSIGPTSEEQLSFATAVGGTFYLNLNGATDVQGTYTLTVQVAPDPTPPQASIVIEGGAAATNDPVIEAVVGGFEDLSGIAEMSLSGDGTTFGPWEPFRSMVSWTLSGGDGLRRLWVRVRNGVGSVSTAAVDEIRLDRDPPSITAVNPPRDSSSDDARPTITVTFDEPILPASWTAGGLVLQSPTGALVPGEYAYDQSTRTGTFRPIVDLVLGTAYIATVGAVTDEAGNAVIPTGSWVLRRQTSTSLTLRASELVIPWGDSVRLSGVARLPVGSVPVLEARRAPSQVFVPEGGLSVSAGTYGATVRPSATTWYRTTFPGTTTVAPASSAEVRVLVRRLVTLAGVSSETTRSVARGRTVILTGVARPARAGIGLSFRLYRYDARSGRYVFAASYGRRTGPDGRASLLWTTRPGRWAWRVAVLADAEYTSNMSPQYRWLVS